MKIQITQFWRPDGRRTQESTTVSDEFNDAYCAMIEEGARFTAEVLMNGLVSQCIEYPDFGDFDIEIVQNDLTEVKKALEDMLRRFDVNRFRLWVKKFE